MRRGWRKAGRVGKWFGFGILGLIGLVVLVAVGALVWLQTESGGGFVRRQVLSRVNENLSGSLDAARIDFRGDVIVLEEVVLKDPDGDVVARIEQVVLDLAPTALLTRTFRMDEIRVVRPEVTVVQDATGTNLQRALEPKEPKPEEEKPKGDKPLPVDVVLKSLTIEEGRVSYENVTSASPMTVLLQDLDMSGALALKDRGDSPQGHLEANAQLSEPTVSPLKLRVDVAGKGDVLGADLSLTADGAEVVARLDQQGEEDLSAVVKRLQLSPAFARAFLPTYPLEAEVVASGRAEKSGGDVRGELDASIGSGRIAGQGHFNLDRFRSEGVEVRATDVDLSEWVEGGPSSSLALTLEARGGGRSLETLDGFVRLNAPASTVAGADFGPIRLDATAKAGTVRLEELFANLPGIVVTGDGVVTREQVQAGLRADVRDFGLFANTLGRLAGPGGLPLDGRGTLTVQLRGETKNPSVAVSGDFPALRHDQTRLHGLTLEASVPKAREPLAGDARVSVSARRVDLGDRALVRPRLSLTLQDRVLELDARTQGFATLSLSARGTVAEDRQGLTLTALRLAWPEATWRLQGNASLRMEEDDVRIEDLVLTSGDQRLALDVAKEGQRIDADVQVQRLALDTLPRAFVDPSLNLGGRVSLTASAKGAIADPAVKANLEVVDVQAKTYEDIDATADVSWRNGRVEGTFKADALGVRAGGDFDLPVEALQEGRAVPVHADLTVEDVAIARLLEETGQSELPLSGTVGATLKLSGNARDPTLVARVHGREIVFRDQPQTELALVARSGDDGTLEVRLTAEALGKESFLVVDTPWTLGRLIRRAPSAEQALAARLSLQGVFDGFPLPVGAPSDPGLNRTGGVDPAERFARLDGTIDLRGTALRPLGTADLRVSNVGVRGGQPAIGAELALDLEAKQSTLSAKVQQAEQVLLEARAQLQSALAELRRPRVLARTPFEVTATWGPLSLMDLQQLAVQPSLVPGEEPPPTLTGISRGTLRAEGTLRDPKVVLEMSAHGLGSANTAVVGDASIRYRYDDKENVLSADVLSAQAGRLQLRAQAPIDLSWDALQKGIQWRSAPLLASLDANGFDPSFLSGIAPTVRQLGGAIDADVDVRGQVALPQVKGQLEWKDGIVVLQGNGEYRNIHLLVRGTEELLVLEELRAEAGRGSARLEGRVKRVGDESLSLQANATLEEFPIVTDDQLAATVSMRATTRGTASMTLVDISELNIPEAHIELPDEGQKDLQELAPPEDVVYLVNGEPLNPEETQDGAAASEDTVAQGGAGEAGASAPEEREIRARVIAPRNLWVRGKDLNVEVGLGENFRVVYTDRPLVFGDVQVIRGHLEVLGKRFEFEEPSIASFTGPVDAPRMNMTAVYENPKEEVTVTLRVAGPPDDLTIEPSSEPPMPDTEIYTLLATGRRTLRPGTTSSGGGGNAATSMLGSLAASRLKGALEDALPLDVLDIDAGERGVSGTRVRVGTYLTDRLYLGIQSQLGARPNTGENVNELQLEYQLWKRLMLELEYGDARQGDADLIWRKQY